MRQAASILTTCLVLAGITLAAGWPAARAEAAFSFATTPGKLPKNVIPIEYRVHIVPDIARLVFNGTVSIEIEVLAPTSTLVLNALEVEIDRARLSGAGGAQSLSAVADKAQQTISFTLPTPLAKGKYTLELVYRGLIGKQSFGLYVNTYRTASGDKVFLGTKMEPADARRLLPCWDEPAFRARFRLSVDLPPNLVAYSNTPALRRQDLPNGARRYAFGPTPKMSSYLLVLMAGEFERISARQDGVEIGVVATQGTVAKGAYALKSAQALLHYYNDYFGVPFPLQKLDLIGVPGGFSGAEEDWGGIPFKESLLLYDPATSADSTRRNVFDVVAHEMAHQWFGDLVTMAWWDNLWLNEGFASWIGTKATARFNPDWNTSLGANEAAMALDARKTTHAIQQRVENEEQAANAFDEIAYEKGQAVVRMMESYIGADAFRLGIRAYMRKHQYRNTTSADLWRALAQASGKPLAQVSQVASDWTTQPGFPVITVEQVCEQGRRHITLSQQQFRLDEGDGVQRSWQVPVQLGVLGARPETLLLGAAGKTFVRAGCSGALLVDGAGVGYYRVHYAPALFEALALQWRTLPDSARLKLLSDTWALAGTGQVPLARYFSLVHRVGDEPRYAIWAQVLGSIATLDQLSAGNPARDGLRALVRGLIASKFAQLGWDERAGETAEQRQLRGALLEALNAYGDPAILAQARTRFERFLVDPASLRASLLNPVIMMVGANADQATYELLKARAEQASSLEEKSRLYYAMFGARDPRLAARSLQLALSPELVPAIRNGVVRFVGQGDNAALAWAFARQHGAALMRGMPAREYNNFYSGVVGASVDAALADEMEALVRATQSPEALTMALRTGSAIRVRAAQKAALLPQLRAIDDAGAR